MRLTIGQKVAYPAQGVCVVEDIRARDVGPNSVKGYFLRVLGDNSTIFVPEANAESVGIRPVLSSSRCRELIRALSSDFETPSSDWKTRSREFIAKIQSGDVFEAADVLKKLTYLSHEKKLSFREQTLLEKAKFLILSELSNAFPKKKYPRESEIIAFVEQACARHPFSSTRAMMAGTH